MLAQPPYSGDAGQLVAGAAIAAPTPAAVPPPRLRLPSHEQITYTRDGLVLVLFLLAFPWLLHKMLTQPGKLLAGSGVKAGL